MINALPQIGAAAGGAAGGLLGQAGDILSAPRRATWGLAAKLAQQAGIGSGEAYNSGQEMIDALLGGGGDTTDPFNQIVGAGAEMLLDPLSYAGGAAGMIGGMLGKGKAAAGLASKAAQEASLAGRLESMAGSGLGSELSKASELASMRQMPTASFLDDVAPVRDVFNPEAAARGWSRNFKNAEPSLAEALEGMGLGARQADGSVDITNGLRGVVSPKGRLAGVSQGSPPSFSRTVRGNADYNLVPDGPLPTGMPTADEMAFLQSQSQAMGPDLVPRLRMIGGEATQIPGQGVDPFKALANSRYLQAKAPSPFDMPSFSGPFTPQIQPAAELPDWLLPALGAAGVGSGMGVAYGLGQRR